MCDCGNKRIIKTGNLTSGNSKSCGCFNLNVLIERSTKHNMSYSRINRIYRDMVQRCNNPKNSRYTYYGGRGITISEEWMNKENGFINFYEWSMNNNYSDELSIDRIEVNGNYEPNNCRWATIKEQQNNKRTNHYININNETMTIKELSEKFDIKYQTLVSRVNAGWTEEKLLSKDQRRKENKIE